MKKVLFTFLLFSFYYVSYAQMINISTGVNATGSPLALGSKDILWKMVSPSPSVGNPYVETAPHSYWIPTPITTGTSAQWIGEKANINSQTPGDYTFERNISVNSNTGVLMYNFSLAVDDQFLSLELVSPTGITTDLSSKVVFKKGYFLCNDIGGSIKCPEAGIWTLRVKVKFIDNLAGFLVSGTMTTEGNCKNPFEDRKCCVGENKENLSTGFENSSNTLFPTNAKDEDWKIVSGPATGPAYQFSYVAYASASSKAQWIAPKGGGSVAGKYVYERNINVPPGYKAKLTFSRIGADNEVTMNTKTASGTTNLVYASSHGGYAFMETRAILKNCISVELPAGLNTLSCEVDNQSGITGLLVEGCYELIKTEPVCKCPEGWLSNTNNENGGVTTDGRCKKMICGPIDLKPLPKNGTQIGDNLGFIWGNEIWWYGTKENGGLPICN